ncbi:MAG: protein-glutamate O-methyltransferase CheR [Nitrospiraceae bacterium]|nr:protein-glutamate O-methyltransferase CheR [Nitrospiraceae bacterium]
MKSHLDRALARVHEVTGIDLAGYRQPMLERRLAARIGKLGLSDEAEYLLRLERDPSECHRFIDAVGINVSSFFRDPLVFEIIREKILPEILERKRRKSSNEIRIWSAGCAGGEEAYSVAILVHVAMKGEMANWAPRIFATDMDENALKTATAAVYARASFEFTKLGILDEYFVPNGMGFEVRPFIKEMVRFSRHDLTSRMATTPPDSVFGTFDLTLCRNVLIYFSRDMQARVLDHLYKSVAQGGYLVLGESESLGRGIGAKLDSVDQNSRIFCKLPR